MNKNEVLGNISRFLGIDSLNPMQAAVAASAAPRIALLSPTGSGKTLAFTLAIVLRLRKDAKSPQAVIIAPSRELVRQIFDVVRPIATGFKTLAMYGGNSFAAEAQSLESQMPDIIVATPGRLLDHMNRGTLTPGPECMVVLDEYDKTLELGFQEEMRRIFKRLPNPSFALVTSATCLDTIPDFVDMDKAETLDFRACDKRDSQRLRIVNVPSADRDKLDTLKALLHYVGNKPAIVFVNHRESADRIGNALIKSNILAVTYHGGMEQHDRELALATFSCRAATVLVATDLAARGLDIDNVAAVIHYHPAADANIWTHRNGRTARVDRSGIIYTITGPDELTADFVAPEHDFYPDYGNTNHILPPMQAIYFDLGKRDKISRGDIAGFIMRQAGLDAGQVGIISVARTYSIAAVQAGTASKVLEAAKTAKLKNKRVRASLL